MADSKKAKERLPVSAPSAGAREERDSATVTVTNAYRNQPVIFHFLGGSIRLGPLESQDIDRTCLSSPELAQLILTGVVTLIDRELSETPRGDGAIAPGETPAIAAPESEPSRDETRGK